MYITVSIGVKRSVDCRKVDILVCYNVNEVPCLSLSWCVVSSVVLCHSVCMLQPTSDLCYNVNEVPCLSLLWCVVSSVVLCHSVCMLNEVPCLSLL